ncbi:hypothetical protein [Pseudanabaena sp. PCC 6802]|uniref:hypothetical protein n=1 Tax=Pseudanabaena sp. PCC 6802 TaxID=118173 RepID=UPI00036A267A|nr:hypothetical protein [Pseudanabaena sp. PCC 6802]
MAKTEPQEYSARRGKKKPKAKGQISYTFVLLILMLAIACISGVVAFVFGQQALQGVNPIPLGGKLPRQIASPDKPTAKPTSKPTSKPANTDKSSLVDDDRQSIARSREDVAGAVASIADEEHLGDVVVPID